MTYAWGPWDCPRWSRQTGVLRMPLNLAMAHCAVRVIGDRKAQEDPQITYRGPIGNGFVVAVPGEERPEIAYHYLVTAAHVVIGRNNVEVQYCDAFTGEFYPPLAVNNWDAPLRGVDVAIAPSPRPDYMNVLALPLNPDEEWNVIQSPNPGMSVLYIGLLAPLNRTMVRSGTIGAPNQAGIKFQGGWQYETHLVDCRSYGGFSGSPCFPELPVPEIEADPHPPSFLPEGKKYGRMGWHAMFVGMFTAHLTDAPQEDDDTPHSRYGMGLMLPAHYVIEALRVHHGITRE
jgi:hypothetical protein